MIKDAFFCSCGSNEHFFVLQRFPDEEEVYLSIYLSHARLHTRIINAVKYLFGYRSRYGDFSEICLDQITQLRLASILGAHVRNFQDVPN